MSFPICQCKAIACGPNSAMSPQIDDAAAGGVEVAQQLQCRPHGRGIRIVGVVDDRRAADFGHFAAHRHGLVVGQGRGDLFQVEAQHAAHGHGGQRPR